MGTATVKEVRSAFEALEKRCADGGMLKPGEHLVLQQGEPSAGIPWAVHVTDTGTRLGEPAWFSSHMGSTKQEAYEALQRANLRCAATDAGRTVSRIVAIMVETEDWGAETLDYIADVLVHAGYARTDDEGMFATGRPATV